MKKSAKSDSYFMLILTPESTKNRKILEDFGKPTKKVEWGLSRRRKFGRRKKGSCRAKKFKITNSAEAPFMVKLDFKITNICLQIFAQSSLENMSGFLDTFMIMGKADIFIRNVRMQMK